MTDPQTFRRSILAHCLSMAKVDPIYARSAAQWYETTLAPDANGLVKRFDVDWSVLKAAKEFEPAKAYEKKTDALVKLIGPQLYAEKA